jgi:hypothetical protein
VLRGGVSRAGAGRWAAQWAGRGVGRVLSYRRAPAVLALRCVRMVECPQRLRAETPKGERRDGNRRR